MNQLNKEQLQVLWKKLLARKNPFADRNYITYQSVDIDRGESRLDIHPENLNPNGVVHGGCIYTLADNAAGVAVHSDGRRHVTQSGNLHFVSNQGEGVFHATAHVIRRGKTVSLIRVEIVGDNERLIAIGDFVFHCVN